MRLIIAATLVLLIAASGAVWWYGFDSRAPDQAESAIQLVEMRALVAGDPVDTLPQAIELYRVGTGEAPMFAVEAGGGFGRFRMAYTAFGARYDDGRVIIDAAVDRQTAQTIGDQKAATFDDAMYGLLLQRIADADLTVLTHEHQDHVMAVVRNPVLKQFADRLWLPAGQVDGLVRHATNPDFESLLRAHETQPLVRAQRIAPGMAIAPSSGHSPGSLTVYARLSSGQEYLFTGDIAWSFQDILKLKTRPRFLQWIMFDPNEQRDQVLAQLRALHDIHEQEPGLVIVPSHDNGHLDALLASGAIEEARP